MDQGTLRHSDVTHTAVLIPGPPQLSPPNLKGIPFQFILLDDYFTVFSICLCIVMVLHSSFVLENGSYSYRTHQPRFQWPSCLRSERDTCFTHIAMSRNHQWVTAQELEVGNVFSIFLTSKTNQGQQNKYYRITLTCELSKCKKQNLRTHWWLPGAGGEH